MSSDGFVGPLLSVPIEVSIRDFHMESVYECDFWVAKEAGLEA